MAMKRAVFMFRILTGLDWEFFATYPYKPTGSTIYKLQP
jgi:hypothetical protein